MSTSKVDELQSEVTLGNKNVRRLLSKQETIKSLIVWSTGFVRGQIVQNLPGGNFFTKERNYIACVAGAGYYGALASTTATAEKTSLLK